VRRHGGEAAFETRSAGDVIGWRVICNCYAPGDVMPTKRWFSQQLWTRVPSPVRHDPNAFRNYAADEDILDVVSGDVYTAGRAIWSSEHISDIDAEAEIRAAPRRFVPANNN
jgi:hypothetical protein